LIKKKSLIKKDDEIVFFKKLMDRNALNKKNNRVDIEY